jgi:ribosomal protein L40E
MSAALYRGKTNKKSCGLKAQGRIEMKFCRSCGAEVVDEAVLCVKCGCNLSQTNKNDKPNGGVLF